MCLLIKQKCVLKITPNHKHTMQLESIANRCCALHSSMMRVVGDAECDVDLMNFAFMLWDHTACGVKMGCMCDDGIDNELLFIVSYDSPVSGKRLFMGVPWVADCVEHEKGRERASPDTVGQFLREISNTKIYISKTNVVFDGNVSVDRPVSLHLHFDHAINGKSLLVKDVAECDNILLVIDMFT